MSDSHNSSPCHTRGFGDKHPTQTLWSRVTGTREECVIRLDEQATHEIKFRNVRRHATDAKVVATCVEDCVQYTESGPDADLSSDCTRLEISLRLEDFRKEFSRQYQIEVCSDHSETEYLKTSLRPLSPTGDQESTSNTVSDGSGEEVVADIQLLPELTITGE
jgi:hypothetical protein